MAVVRYDTDTAQATRAQKALNDAIDQLEKKADGAAKKLTAAEKAAKALAAQADPHEKNARQLERLAKAVKEGGLGLDNAQKLAVKYQRQLEAVTMETRELEDAGEGAFGSRMLNRLGAVVASLGILKTGVAAVQGAYAEAEAQAKETTDAMIASVAEAGTIQQVAGDPKTNKAVRDYALNLIERGVFSPTQRTEAYRAAYSLEGANFSDEEKELIALAGETKYVSPTELTTLAESLRTVQNLFGKEEAGSLNQILDKMIVAGGATKASASETALAMTSFGASARSVGLTDEEAAAALVIQEANAANIKVAGSVLDSLFNQVSKRGLGGGSLNEILDRIQARIDAGETEYEVLSESRAVEGFRTLQGRRALLDEELGKQQGAEGTFAESAGKAYADDPKMLALIELQKRRGKASVTFENSAQAEAEVLIDLLSAEIDRRLAAGEINRFQASLDKWVLEKSDKYNMEERSIIAALTNDAENMDQTLLKLLSDYLYRQTLAAEQTARNTAAGSTRPE